MRIFVIAASAALLASPARGQRYSAADSGLVARLLLAEERRDTSAAAYDAGLRHDDARIRMLARRGLERSRDPLYARRDTTPPRPAPPVYDEPQWRLRYRQLGRNNDNCRDLRRAMTDSAWPVRIRGAALVTAACAEDAGIRDTLRAWIRMLPSHSRRTTGGVSWHPAVQALGTLARIAPAEARAALPAFSGSPVPAVRMFAARAAGVLADTATLRRLATDEDDNVKEDAITALARVAGHAHDDVMIPALGGRGYQAVRAAARALRETPLRDRTLAAAIDAATRLRRDSSETSRDARSALVQRIAEFAAPGDWSRIAPLASDFDCTIADSVAALGRRLGIADATPRCTPLPIALPADAVRIALGADVRLRVTMADTSGGGSFVVRMRGDVAPVMAARVVALARDGYYNGLTWHRVEHDFVTQGGGPGANEYVGHPRFFRDELGHVPHVRGTIGMSTRGHDTGDAQWFFNLRDNLRLNRDYTIFAEVVEGITIVDGIMERDVIARIDVVR